MKVKAKGPRVACSGQTIHIQLASQPARVSTHLDISRGGRRGGGGAKLVCISRPGVTVRSFGKIEKELRIGEGKTFRGLELGRWFGRGEGTELRDKSQTATSTITWRLRMAGALRRRTYVPMYVCMYNGRLHAFRPLADVCRWGMQSCVLSFFPLSPLLSAPPIAATGEAADERLSFLRHRLGGRAGGRAWVFASTVSLPGA